MTKQTYPDGSWVELGWGDTSPPGHVGLHTNVARPWVRRDRGEWRRLTGVRAHHHAVTLLMAGENAAEVMEVLTSVL